MVVPLQSIVQKLLVDVAKHAPETALSALVNDVLADSGNWEATLVGLQALLTILFDGPQHSSLPADQQVPLHCGLSRGSYSAGDEKLEDAGRQTLRPPVSHTKWGGGG